MDFQLCSRSLQPGAAAKADSGWCRGLMRP
jgi:hypothetical protein